MIDHYLKGNLTKDVELPDGDHDVVRKAETFRKALARKPVPLLPAIAIHYARTIDEGDRMWIMDWEYAGMNDPMWDLGDLSVEGGFDDAQDQEMLMAYFDG